MIAALYLDGGLGPARDFVLANWQARIRAARSAPQDAKTRMQEWAQGRGMAPPDYVLVSRSGPDHAPVFVVEARLGTGAVTQGEARSKKLAEQAVAEALWETLDDGS